MCFKMDLFVSENALILKTNKHHSQPILEYFFYFASLLQAIVADKNKDLFETTFVLNNIFINLRYERYKKEWL